MTMRGIVDGLNKETAKAIARVCNIVGAPSVIIIGLMGVGKLNTIIANQDRHELALQRDSINITKLFRNDQLLAVRQDATVTALKINLIVGDEFKEDYKNNYNDLFEDLLKKDKFLNP